MEWGTVLLVALVLGCPISMMWMMRGQHGKQGRDREVDTKNQDSRDDGDRAISEKSGAAVLPDADRAGTALQREIGNAGTQPPSDASRGGGADFRRGSR